MRGMKGADPRVTVRVLPVFMITVLAVAPGATQSGSSAPSTSFRAITVETVAVPLNPHDPSASTIGDFQYAGGFAFRTRDTTTLHELSDLVITGDDHLVAIGDEGVWFEARLLFDEAGRLAGLTDARIARLAGENGRALGGEDADAEGLTLLPNGDRLVSFEKHPRIWLYPRTGARPRAVPSPRAIFKANAGMEALAADPDAGADAYVVGVEESGATWTCRVTSSCVEGPTVEKPVDFGLVSMTRLPDRMNAYLLRAYDGVRGVRVVLSINRASTVVSRLELAPPLTVDNFEGVTSLAGTNGQRRFYLMSDDNNDASQRTLLLAFDWKPAK